MRYIPHVQLKRFDKVLLGIIITIFLIYTIGTFFLGSATFVDVLRGYVSMEQFLNGESFNTLNYELSSGKISYFVAWWTPGQYLLPYALKGIGMSLANAQSILIILFMGVSLVGYMRLFRFFRFPPRISLLSILLILTNHLFFWNSLMYFGGSLFEVALLPWFLLFLLQIKTFNFKTSLVYFAVALVLFFLKATFLMHVGIGLGVLLLDFKSRQKSEIVTIVLTGLSILSVCYFSFLQFGETPSSAVDEGMYNGIPNNLFNDVFTPIASVTGIPFVIGIVVQKLLPDYPWAIYLGYVIMPILALCTFLLFRKMWSKSTIERKLVQFTSVFFILFMVLFITNRAVSYDFRHFAPLAFVFLPFIIRALRPKIESLHFYEIAFLLLMLVGFNLFSFLIKRVSVMSSSLNDGISYHHPNRAEIGISQNDNQTITKETKVILMNNWELMPYFLNAKVIPTYNIGDNWYLKSGMELDHPKKINLKKEIAKHDSCLIIFDPFGGIDISYLFDKSEFETISFTRTRAILLRR